MLVNVEFFANDFDIIDVPDYLAKDIENVQQKFWDWLYDESSNHNYWTLINGIRCYSYGSDEFVDWINKFLLHETDEKAIIVSRLLTEYNNDNPTICF